MKRIIITSLAISFSFFSLITEAKVYKWKDDNGQIHYASTPPKVSEKTITLKQDFYFSPTKKASTKKSPSADTIKKDENTTNNQPQKISKLERCNKEKKNLELLRKNSNVTWIENGKKTPLAGKLLEDKIKLLNKNISEHCSSPSAPNNAASQKLIQHSNLNRQL